MTAYLVPEVAEMNILEIVSNRTGMNGAINHCLLLSRELAMRGHCVTLVCHPHSWIAEHAAREGIETVLSDLHRWPLDELRRIAGEVRRREIDVIHTHLSRAHFFGVLLRWLSGVPCVATAHSYHFQLHWMFNDYVIANSEATRRFHESYNLVRPNRIETIHAFIDYRRMSATTAAVRAETRAALGVGDSTPLIGAIGNVTPRKGAHYLVRALPRILAAAPDTMVMLVGEALSARYVAEVRATAEKLDVAAHLLWLGHRDDVDAIMAAMDVCVLPSLSEPLGMAILEAMAAGLPVVATTVGGIPECLGDCPAGKLVPPADSEALAGAVVELLCNPTQRRTCGEEGRRRVREHFSAESQTPCIEAVLARVARYKTAA